MVMKELPLHDAQIIHILFSPVLDAIEYVLHRCDEEGQYYLVTLKIIGTKSIDSIDGKDFQNLFDSGGGVYDAKIDYNDDIEVLDISGPEYWRTIITASKIEYNEQPVTESKINEILNNNIGIDI